MRPSLRGLRLFGLALLAASVAPSIITACASERSAFIEEIASPPFDPNDAGEPGECQDTVRCSRDLKKVLRRRCDGTEEVLRECGPELGCGNGTCVEACTSAELSKGSIGCSFSTLPPDDTMGGTAGSCFAAMIANTWDRPVTVQAELGTSPLEIGPSTYYAEKVAQTIEYTPVEGAILPGKVAIVFLAESASGAGEGWTACPKSVVPALREDPIAHGTTRTRSFRLTTDAPVSAYSIYPYGGASSYFPTATLLLPISSWGTNYVAVSTWTSPSLGAPTIQVVAAEDDTVVRMRPNVDIGDGYGVSGVAQGRTQSWTLARGEVLQITQRHDTSGSPIEANKPVALFGGAQCTNIPASSSACDLTQQQIPPVSQWGSDYALVPYRPRIGSGEGTNVGARELVPWRLVGAVNGTKLTYDPVRPAGAPEELQSGQVVTFMTTELVSVRSQDDVHPFYAALFMTGASMTSSSPLNGRLGDPDFVNVIPSAQFLDRYIFFVDFTYAETTLTFVRRKTPTGFHSVTLACAGEVTDWKPLGAAGEYEYAWVQLTKVGTPQVFAGGTCNYGRHEARSDGPFSVTVWGMDDWSSYGYAGGAGSRPLSDVKGPPVN
ncbi:MAG: IgGFc-binding protein [Labilithrix sp.]|nr:IgGFc-binding protein [Labilithrix sp.]